MTTDSRAVRPWIPAGTGPAKFRRTRAAPRSGDDRVPYLRDVPLDEARARFHQALRDAGALAAGPAVSVALEAAVGRVTASAVWARTSNPHYHAAAMDGIAVAAEMTSGASPTSPLRLRVDGDAVWVDTGDAMPPGTDAVVMAEDVHDVGDGSIEILAAVAPWQHVRPLGEDIVATELVLPAGHTLRPVDVAAAAAAGHASIEVQQHRASWSLPPAPS